MSNPTYYQQVKTFVDPHLKFFRDDLLKHDLKELRGYKGEFIHSSRESGTDLLKFSEMDTGKQYEWAVAFTCRGTNTLFLHGKDGMVKQITREQAIKIVRQRALPTAHRWVEKSFAGVNLSEAIFAKYVAEEHKRLMVQVERALA